MTTVNTTELLKDKDILDEINKHKWIESEKSGRDIGFEQASRDWITAHSQKYLMQHPNKTAVLWFKTILNKKIY